MFVDTSMGLAGEEKVMRSQGAINGRIEPHRLAQSNGSQQAAAALHTLKLDPTSPLPVELLHLPPGTSKEIESVVRASIRILNARCAEEKRPLKNNNGSKPQFFAKEINQLRLQQLIARQFATRQGGQVAPLRKPSKGKEKITQAHQDQVPKIVPPEAQPSSNTGNHKSHNRLFRSSRRVSRMTPMSSEAVPSSHPATGEKPRWGFHRFRPYTTIFKPRGLSPRAILSRYTSASASASDNSECVSCMDQFRIEKMVRLKCHDYCRECFVLLIETSISTETFWPARCCDNEVPISTVLNNLRGKIRARYETIAKERSIPADQRVYCSKASCGSIIPLCNIDKGLVLARCARCRHKTCTTCRGKYHPRGECPDDPDLQATLSYANQEGWRRCYNCFMVVEHNQGCHHIMCRCRAQFCYICGSKWHTCNCEEADLEEHLASVVSRKLAQRQISKEAYIALKKEIKAAKAAGPDQAILTSELREVLQTMERLMIDETGKVLDKPVGTTVTTLGQRILADDDSVQAAESYLRRLRNEMNFVNSIQQTANFDRYEAGNTALADAARAELNKIEVFFHDLDIGQYNDAERRELPVVKRLMEDGVNAELDDKQEQLKAAHEEDRRWFNVADEVRAGMLLDIVLGGYRKL